ncbi:MAG TPA: fumarylacetoacetate hydrolase family protein, partial [Verrucomicrobiae bacterium]|nr:fumarylacetoacetate hydrolase family protein [Verrucomicrobiae bacterium]
MKIVRYEDVDGKVGYAAQQPDGSAKRINGDIYGSFQVMEETATVSRLLAPVMPVQIFGIGLNFRHHATETNTPVPKFPILFMKGINTVQNPGEPIFIPTVLPSHEVDYECELAVVIGKKCKNVTREKALDYVLG